MDGIRTIPDKMTAFPRLRCLLNWTYDLLFLSFLVGGVFYFVAAFGEGGTFWERLGDVYTSMVDVTTDGTKWTLPGAARPLRRCR